MSVSLFNGYSPGRVELLGNHTDYNQGRVLAGAIDRGLAVSGHANPECRIRLRSIALKRSVDVAVNAIVPQAAEPWADYALGVVKEFLSAGVEISGFDATVSGDLPAGGGLSSSAAFELATAHFLLKLHGSTMEPMALAKLCQRAENGFTAVRSGLLDQATCTFGREEHAVMLDCRCEEVTLIPFPPA